MKLRVLTVFIIIISIFSITVSAAAYDFDVIVGDNFTAARQDEDMSALSQKLGMTNEQLTRYYADNKLVYLAVSNDKQSQLKISVSDDNFSAKADDISHLSDNALLEFANAIDEKHTIVTNKERKFVCSKSSHKDSGGEYTVTQYVTIKDGKTFYFIGYNPGRETSAEITNAFYSFTLKDSPNVWWTIIRIGGIVVFSAVAVFMIVGITKNLRTKDED